MMREGWVSDDYLILFDDSEVTAALERYSLSLAGYEIVGLRNWDDFIIRDRNGNTYCVPTVPAIPEYVSTFSVPDVGALQSDARFSGKIKWHVKPIVFGGDPQQEDNVAWVGHEQHVQLVKWWNDQYRAIKSHHPS